MKWTIIAKKIIALEIFTSFFMANQSLQRQIIMDKIHPSKNLLKLNYKIKFIAGVKIKHTVQNVCDCKKKHFINPIQVEK